MVSPNIQAFNSNIVSDEESKNYAEDENDDKSSIQKQSHENVWASNRRHPDLPDSVFQTMTREQNVTSSEKIHIIPTEDVEVQADTPQAKLLAWHYRLGHLPFGKIQQLAKRGDLPSALASCSVPKGAACLFGRETR